MGIEMNVTPCNSSTFDLALSISTRLFAIMFQMSHLLPSFKKKLKPTRGLKSDHSLLPSGWRRSALVNIALMSTALSILVVVLAVAVSKTGGNLRQSWIFHETDCRSNSTSTVNTLLHLLINILSTLALASSNFFMQVLNAPSRREIDNAHSQGLWLDIGIPSWRNALRLSRFNFYTWIGLLLTSIPIHMLFNSSVFQMNTRMGDFHLIVATESFVKGGSYSIPGASLFTKDIFTSGRDIYFPQDPLIPNFLDLTTPEYSSRAVNVSKAAAGASNWERLEAPERRNIYGDSCAGLSEYRNLVVVARGPGWRRSDLWNLSATADQLWEPVVPRGQLNTLWYFTQCTMKGTLNGTTPICSNSCLYSLANNSTSNNPDSEASRANSGDRWLIPLRPWYNTSESASIQLKPKQPVWNVSLYSAPGNTFDFGRRFDLDTFEISHCLAEPRQTDCAVAVSKPLLLAVAISIFLKVVICVVAFWVLGSQEPLVTPGDAVASFISILDQHTVTSGPLTLDIIQRRRRRNREKYDICQPFETQKFIRKQHRSDSAVSRRVRLTTYAVLIFGVLATMACLSQQIINNIPLEWIKLDTSRPSSVFPAIGEGAVFVNSVLIVNMPQLYLSFWYLTYNSLITRLEMSREWALFSTNFFPLRVTVPKGQQVATYRLQLPYRYSISFIIMSIITHWLLSNAFFVVVTRGSYYQARYSAYSNDPISLPDGSTVSLSSASLPVLLLALIGPVMILLLIILSRRALPGCMPVVGSNSLAISAACQVSPLVKDPTSLTTDIGTELEDLIPPSNENSEVEEISRSGRERMVFYPLKWGEVEMPREFYGPTEDVQSSRRVGHLSFGTVLDNPELPTEGRWYN